MTEQVEIVVDSHPKWLRLVRRVTDEFTREAGLDATERQNIILAVDEAMANVIKHAYGGDTAQKIWLRCRLDEGFVQIELRDRGAEFSPTGQPERAPDEVRPGGRGIYLMRQLMDEIHYAREDGYNSVTLRKRLPALETTD